MDSTNTLPQIETNQSQKEATANMLFAAASTAMAYANNGDTTIGLVFGYLGARYDESSLIAGGTHTCTASTTVYMVVDKSDGTVSFDTASTDWDDHANFGQAYLITAGTTSLTFKDCRGSPNPYGILGAGGAPVGAPGSGDVVGPGSAVNNHLAVFDGTSGKLIKDGGAAPSGTNTGDETAASIAAIVHAATGKTTPVDADEIPIADSAASFALKKLTWANLKAGVWSALGALIAAGTTKATPVDGDLLPLSDSAASSATKYLSWLNLKATLKTYFDTLYAATGSAGTVTHTGGALTANAVVLGAGTDDAKVVAGITTDGTSALNLGVAGASVGKVVMANATSGTVQIQPVTGALGTSTLLAPAVNATLLTTAATLVDQWCVNIATVANQSYTIVLDTKFACTINEITTQSDSGTCTLTGKINSTALGGTANSVSTSESTQTHSSANSVATGDNVVLTASSNSSCLGMAVTIKYTRLLA